MRLVELLRRVDPADATLEALLFSSNACQSAMRITRRKPAMVSRGGSRLPLAALDMVWAARCSIVPKAMPRFMPDASARSS